MTLAADEGDLVIHYKAKFSFSGDVSIAPPQFVSSIDSSTRSMVRERGRIRRSTTFPEPVFGVQAAVDMLRALADFNQTASASLVLKIGLHRGRSLAVSLNDRIDYFGQEVNIAARVQQLAGADEIVLSKDVYDEPGVADLLASCDIVEDAGIMKGVAEQIPVYRARFAAE